MLTECCRRLDSSLMDVRLLGPVQLAAAGLVEVGRPSAAWCSPRWRRPRAAWCPHRPWSRGCGVTIRRTAPGVRRHAHVSVLRKLIAKHSADSARILSRARWVSARTRRQPRGRPARDIAPWTPSATTWQCLTVRFTETGEPLLLIMGIGMSIQVLARRILRRIDRAQVRGCPVQQPEHLPVRPLAQHSPRSYRDRAPPLNCANTHRVYQVTGPCRHPVRSASPKPCVTRPAQLSMFCRALIAWAITVNEWPTTDQSFTSRVSAGRARSVRVAGNGGIWTSSPRKEDPPLNALFLWPSWI